MKFVTDEVVVNYVPGIQKLKNNETCQLVILSNSIQVSPTQREAMEQTKTRKSVIEHWQLLRALDLR